MQCARFKTKTETVRTRFQHPPLPRLSFNSFCSVPGFDLEQEKVPFCWRHPHCHTTNFFAFLPPVNLKPFSLFSYQNSSEEVADIDLLLCVDHFAALFGAQTTQLAPLRASDAIHIALTCRCRSCARAGDGHSAVTNIMCAKLSFIHAKLLFIHAKLSFIHCGCVTLSVVIMTKGKVVACAFKRAVD